MNDKQRPTLQELSFYYDGLLEGEEKRQVEEYLQENQSNGLPLEMFESIDNAICPSYSEEDVDSFLHDTLKNVHERIHETPRREEWSWSFIFTPKFLVSALSLFLLISVISLQVDFTSDRLDIHQNMPDERENIMLSQLDQQRYDFMKSTASKVWNQGLQLAAEQSQQLKESVGSIPKDNQMGLTMDVIQNAFAQTPLDEKMKKEEGGLSTLASLGQKLLTLGLSASLMTLMSLF